MRVRLNHDVCRRAIDDFVDGNISTAEVTFDAVVAVPFLLACHRFTFSSSALIAR